MRIGSEGGLRVLTLNMAACADPFLKGFLLLGNPLYLGSTFIRRVFRGPSVCQNLRGSELRLYNVFPIYNNIDFIYRFRPTCCRASLCLYVA